MNAELIQFIEATPDTVVTLSSKEKVLVKEAPEEIIRRVLAWQKSIRTFLSP